jgi:hypothetical protein
MITSAIHSDRLERIEDSNLADFLCPFVKLQSIAGQKSGRSQTVNLRYNSCTKDIPAVKHHEVMADGISRRDRACL